MELSEFDRGWLTALIDSEGCFSTVGKGNKKKGQRIALTIWNTSKALLERVRTLLGEKGGMMVKKPDRWRKKNLYGVKYYGGTLLKLLPLICDDLIVKKEQALITLEFYQEDKNRKRRGAAIVGDLTPRQKEILELLPRLNT